MARATAKERSKPSARAVDAEPALRREGHRDTVEAIVVALILALVVRGFEAQAFVIPTGSMAPTLMGRHKEVACPECGFTYAVNASEEVELGSLSRDVYSGICGNCRFQTRLDADPSFKGDRILVMMFPYDLPNLPGSSPPERYDVVVFRYPEDPEVSYIKRLVGLPGETIRIYHGDAFVKKPGAADFVLARKPWRHLQSLAISVHDDRYQPRALRDRPEWRRYQGGNWTAASETSRYETKGAASTEWSELRYRHLNPEPDQWDAIKNDRVLPRPPRSKLVTDFYSYNTNMVAGSTDLLDDPRGEQEGAWRQPHWVGDLVLDFTLDVAKAGPQAAARIELVKGGVPGRCEIDLATGEAVFSRGGVELGKASTTLKGAGSRRIQFANVDNRLTLVVDGVLAGGEGFEYEAGEGPPIPTEADLAPVGVAVRGADAAAADLVLKRDIYYTQTPGRLDYGAVWEDRYPSTPTELNDFLSDPARFPDLKRVGMHDYPIGPDRYFMMGDNSPRSKDSRGWDTLDAAWDPSERKSWEVPRELITGKAFFIYWPHGVPFGPDIRLNKNTRLIFRPYFERMKWIR